MGAMPERQSAVAPDPISKGQTNEKDINNPQAISRLSRTVGIERKRIVELWQPLCWDGYPQRLAN
jgi:hypothetical protein